MSLTRPRHASAAVSLPKVYPGQVTKDISIENHKSSNCGEIHIIKHTDPRGIDQNFDYTSDIWGSQLSCSPDVTPPASR
jgi:hypothetical protein